MQPLKLIKINSTGPLVKSWQYFLMGQGYYKDDVDGKFGPNTREASIEFQRKHGLQPDGIIGNKSFGVAMQFGFEGVEDIRKDKSGADWPSTPAFSPLTGNAARQRLFGMFTYQPAPLPGNPENIRITNNWARENIVIVTIPQVKHITGNDKIPFHKSAADQLINLWKGWQAAGLLHLVLSYEGSYVARFVRGKAAQGILSNHAFGSAFDI